MKRLLLAWMVVTPIAVVLHGEPRSAVSTLVESLIYLGLFAWLARRPGVERLLAELPRTWRTGVIAFMAALVLGQLTYRSAQTFPLVAWDMYGRRPQGDPHYYEFAGVTRDGREVELNFAREFLALNRQVMTGLQKLADRIDTEPDRATRAELERNYRATIGSLVRRYNEIHRQSPVSTVRVWKRTIPSRPFRGRDTIRRDLYRQLSVE